MRGKYLPGMGTREETIALWEEISGKSAADIEWYEEFTQLKMACTGVRLGALRGRGDAGCGDAEGAAEGGVRLDRFGKWRREIASA